MAISPVTFILHANPLDIGETDNQIFRRALCNTGVN